MIPPKLNLGCGASKRSGWWNVDICADYQPDQLLDLNRALPYRTGYFLEINLSHVLEHVIFWDQLLSECNRILAPFGRIEIAVPDFDFAVKQYLLRTVSKYNHGCELSGKKRSTDWNVLIYGRRHDVWRGRGHVMGFSWGTGREENDLELILQRRGFAYIHRVPHNLHYQIVARAMKARSTAIPTHKDPHKAKTMRAVPAT